MIKARTHILTVGSLLNSFFSFLLLFLSTCLLFFLKHPHRIFNLAFLSDIQATFRYFFLFLSLSRSAGVSSPLTCSHLPHEKSREKSCFFLSISLTSECGHPSTQWSALLINLRTKENMKTEEKKRRRTRRRRKRMKVFPLDSTATVDLS